MKSFRTDLPVHAARQHLIPLWLLLLVWGAETGLQAAASNSVARVWDERALAAIRVDTPHPPAQARNLFSLSVCMWAALAAYNTNGAVGCIYRGRQTAADAAPKSEVTTSPGPQREEACIEASGLIAVSAPRDRSSACR